MRKTVSALAVLVAVAGFLTPAAEAQICIDFLLFCDGLELYIAGDTITGFWRNRHCEGVDSPLVGLIQDGIPNPCQAEPGRVGVACLPEFGCDQFDGNDEWYFVFNEPNGIVDFGHSEDGALPPPGACGIVGGISYQILFGPCPFGPESVEPSISSEDALR